MATIAENLLALQQTKENFKTAFAEKEVDLTGVPFTEYPNKMSEIKTSEDLDTELTEQETSLAKLEEDVNALSDKPKTDGEYFVKVIDYDGTILKEARLDTGDTFTLPKPPSHNDLVFQEWSCSQEIVDNVITIEDNNVMVGAVYTTASGLSEFDIELTKGLAPNIETNGYIVSINMDGTKDWGDGTSDDLTSHAYTRYGKYTIKCNGTTMTSSSSKGIFNQTSGSRNYWCINVRFADISTISSGAFYYCSSLTSVTLSNSVTSIDSYAFSSCYLLTSITIPNSVTSIGSYMSQDCYSLKNIAIPNGVTSIGSYAFYYCSSLTSVTIPNSVTSIGSYAFQYCRFITSIAMPNSVTSIGSYAFQHCNSLKNITLSNSVTSIGSNAFQSCYLLTSIAIPNSVTSIGSYAFGSCLSLTTYDFSTHTAVPTLSSTNAFSSINGIAKIIVPDNLYEKWIVATNWATYANHIHKASEVL